MDSRQKKGSKILIFAVLLVSLSMLLVACNGVSVELDGGLDIDVNDDSDDMVDSDTMPADDMEDVDEMEVEDMEEDDMEDADDMMAESDADVTFVLGGENFKFTMGSEDNPDLVVSEGDLVRIEFTSDAGFHDWVVDEFSAATEKVSEGDSTYVEFVADAAGTYEYYCSVGSHRAAGMFGNLIVE